MGLLKKIKKMLNYNFDSNANIGFFDIKKCLINNFSNWHNSHKNMSAVSNHFS